MPVDKIGSLRECLLSFLGEPIEVNGVDTSIDDVIFEKSISGWYFECFGDIRTYVNDGGSIDGHRLDFCSLHSDSKYLDMEISIDFDCRFHLDDFCDILCKVVTRFDCVFWNSITDCKIEANKDELINTIRLSNAYRFASGYSCFNPDLPNKLLFKH